MLNLKKEMHQEHEFYLFCTNILPFLVQFEVALTASAECLFIITFLSVWCAGEYHKFDIRGFSA